MAYYYAQFLTPELKAELEGTINAAKETLENAVSTLEAELDNLIATATAQANELKAELKNLAEKFRFETLGIYIYASTESIMKNALKKVGLHKFAYERVETDEGNILRIDKHGTIERTEFEPKLYRSKYAAWYDYDDSTYYNIHEEILLAYCGMYGVDSSDVELLLEYGYTFDEIEEMLMDTNLLHEALRDIKFMCGEAIYEECCGGAW